MTSVELSEFKTKTVRFWFENNTKENTREFELKSVDAHALHHILCAEFKIPVETFLWYAKQVGETETIIPESSFPIFAQLKDKAEYEIRCVKVKAQ